MTELLPCPFCGNKHPSTYWDYKPENVEEHWEGYNIMCCGIHISNIYKDEAIERWNTRSKTL